MFMSSYRQYKMTRHLAELIDLGVELAGDLKRQALRADSARAKADLALAFAAVADEVRRSVVLEARLLREAREDGASAPPRRQFRPRVAEPAEPAEPDPLSPKIVKH
jgi:hypothetical protein